MAEQSETPTDHQSPRLVLTAVQRRIVGVLIEKSFTTPDQYPLTLHAIVVACNQKSNRNPVVQYTENQVAVTLQEVVRKGLVKYAEVPGGARVNRFEHNVAAACGWAPREQAVLAELILRGPQTVGELRTRAGRMVSMRDLQYVHGILDELAAHDPPLVRALPREPGRSAVRYAHTLYPDEEDPARAIIAAATTGVPGATTTDATCTVTTGGATASAHDQTLARRLDELEQRVAALENRLDTITGS